MASILLIDDDPHVLVIMRRILEGKDHEVRTASDGRAGARAYRDRPADIVITDIYMPGQDGIETMLELLAEFPGAKIIAMSGAHPSSAPDVLQDAQLFGAVRILAKPFSATTLLATVDEYLP